MICHTQLLQLGGNQIGDAGLAAFAKAVESGALPALEQLELTLNKIGDVGLSALASACASGALPRALPALQILQLSGNNIGDAGLTALADACASGALPKCTTIMTFGNPASVVPSSDSRNVRTGMTA